MPNTTPRYGWQYATLTDPPNGPSDEGTLALAVENTVGSLQDSMNAQKLWRASRSTSATETTQTVPSSAQGVLRIDGIPIINGHLYQVRISAGYYSSINGRVRTRLTVNTGGSVATAATTVIRDVQHVTRDTGLVIESTVYGQYTATSTTTLSVLFSHYIVSGAGNGGRYADGTWPMLLTVEDKGVDPGATGTSI